MNSPQYTTSLGMLKAKGLEETPEYSALQEAVNLGQPQLSAISLEVLLSHYRARFHEVELRYFKRLAGQMRLESWEDSQRAIAS